jgi:hypothetical protein
MKENKVRYKVGSKELIVRPRVPFDEVACAFLDDFSKMILKDVILKTYTDVVSFAFWIRKANIQKQKVRYTSPYVRLGRGLVFHIAPSNVPINGMFTFVFGLLSGNSNIVKLSSKEFPQIELLCDKLNRLLEKEEYRQIKEENAFIQYESKEEEIAAYYSSIADMRVIWGGDAAIREIRTLPLKPRSKELCFADRYSFGMIEPEYILGLSKEELKNLAKDFYNDTYLMDQNACSTPHILYWLSADEKRTELGKERFWEQVYQEAKRYDLQDVKASEKYTNLCLYAAKHQKAVEEELTFVKRYDNLLYVIDEKTEEGDLCEKRGKFGMFYQRRISDLDEILPFINEKIQTVAAAGVEKEIIQKWVVKNRLLGIDRVVDFGKTLDIGLIWDGYDLLSEMTRMIQI